MKQPKILHYQDSGRGPVVVLLHGYLASSRYWDKTAVMLAKDHRVIAIDLLGFGKSPKPSYSRYDLDAQLVCIDATLSSLGLNEPFNLAGHSMGSLVALHYAKNRPERVSKLLLANMPMYSSSKEARKDVYATRVFYRFVLQPGLHGLIWPGFKLVMNMRLIPEKVTGNMKTHKQYMFQSNGYSRIRSMRNLIFQAKVEADLMALDVTTIVLSGINERAVYLRNLYTYQLAQHIQTRIVEGGHHLPQTNPRLVAQLIN